MLKRVALMMGFVLLIGCFFAFAENIKLEVPLLLEYGAEIGVYSGAKTCGPCSLEMCAAYLQSRKPSFENVKRINAFLDPSRVNDDYYLRHGEFTTWGELVEAGKKVYGLEGLQAVPFNFKKIIEELKKGAPVIVSIENYGAIPERHDKNYSGGHFLVVCGVNNNKVICQDPDNPTPFVEYNLENLKNAVGDYYIIIGFEPLKVAEIRPHPEERKAIVAFNFPIENIEGSGVYLRKGKLEVPFCREAKKYPVVVRARGRVGRFILEVPRFMPEEKEEPLVWLNGKYFVSYSAPFALIAPGYKMERWVVGQKGNHILIVSRLIMLDYDNKLKVVVTGVGVKVYEAIIREATPEEYYGRDYYVIELIDGGIDKILQNSGRRMRIGETCVYVSKDGRRVVVVEVENGRRTGSIFRFDNVIPAAPLPSNILEEIERIRKEVFGG